MVLKIRKESVRRGASNGSGAATIRSLVFESFVILLAALIVFSFISHIDGNTAFAADGQNSQKVQNADESINSGSTATTGSEQKTGPADPDGSADTTNPADTTTPEDTITPADQTEPADTSTLADTSTTEDQTDTTTPEELKQGWVKENGTKHYYIDGVLQKSTWLDYDGARYWLDKDGKLVKGAWIKYKNARYYLKKNGKLATDQWVKDTLWGRLKKRH